MRVRPRLATIAILATLATLAALVTTACDQLNKPFGNTSSSSSSSSGGSRATTDGGEPGSGVGEAGTVAPAPTITAQPGDIQL